MDINESDDIDITYFDRIWLSDVSDEISQYVVNKWKWMAVIVVFCICAERRSIQR